MQINVHLMAVDRPSDRRNTFFCRYQTRADRSRIHRIDRCVATMVDTGYQQVNRLVGKQHLPRQFDAICRRSVGRIDLGSVQVVLGDLAQVDRRHNGYSGAVSASRTVRRNNRNMPQPGHFLSQQAYARGSPTVIVNDYDVHAIAFLILGT